MSDLPDFVEGTVGSIHLGVHGTITVSSAGDGLEVSTEGAPTVRVFDVWVNTDGEWCQLNRTVDGAWALEDVTIHSEDQVRLWLASLEPPAVLPEPEPPPPPVLEPYVPIVDGAPPLPEERDDALSGELLHWARRRGDETVVRASAEAWSVACATAQALGWSPALPAGEDLLLAYARSGPAAAVDLDEGFCRWLAFELGRTVRRGVRARHDLEERLPAIRELFGALGALVRAMAPGLEFVATPPATIGPLERHRWLVDDVAAGRIGNTPAPDSPHRPVFVLRPLLTRGDEVVVEGVVV